jgi:hypothetical protein
MFRVFVVGKTAYITEESDSNFKKSHNLRSQDVELIASYANRDALTSKQFERSLNQYKVENVIDESSPAPRRPPNIFRDYSPEQIAEIKEKISKSLTGRTIPDHVRAKMAQAKRNRPSNNKGKRRSIIANINQSEGMKGKKCVEGYITYSEPYSGKQVRLPEGVEPPPGFYKGLTQEQREIRRETAKRMWYKRKRVANQSG